MDTFAPAPVQQGPFPAPDPSFGGGGGDMGGLFALFVILVICFSLAGFVMRLRYGGGWYAPRRYGGGWYGPRRYGFRPWGPQMGMGGPIPPGPPWDPMQANPAGGYLPTGGVPGQADPLAGSQPGAPWCDPNPPSAGFASCDPGGGTAPAAGDGGGTMGSVSS